jgi:pilus assembly protein CpaB
MWKVKRMNTARIVVLTTADGVGGMAAYLANRSDSKPLPTPTQPPRSPAQSRAPLIAGEPIPEPTLVKTNAAGSRSAILPTGMRVARPTATQK